MPIAKYVLGNRRGSEWKENFMQFRCYNCLACGHLPIVELPFRESRNIFGSFSGTLVTASLVCGIFSLFGNWELLSFFILCMAFSPAGEVILHQMNSICLFIQLSFLHLPLMWSFCHFPQWTFSYHHYVNPSNENYERTMTIIIFRYSHVDKSSGSWAAIVQRRRRTITKTEK